MKRIFVFLLVVCLLAGCAAPAKKADPTASTPSSTAPSGTTGSVPATTPSGTHQPSTTAKGSWVKKDGKNYYLKPDGSYATGKVVIDKLDYFFDESGAQVLLVNPWYFIPHDYTPDLVTFYEFAQYEDGNMVDKSCLEPLLEMLEDCQKAGNQVRIVSSYRRQETQQTLYNNKVDYFLGEGYDIERAREEAGKIVAVPGTSEHQLGLAVDLIDKSYPYLDAGQESTPAQGWLLDHCWDYGFILRYPNDKSEHTGIIYEPWHYRYVGKALAAELKESELCLEEYFESLS